MRTLEQLIEQLARQIAEMRRTHRICQIGGHAQS